MVTHIGLATQTNIIGNQNSRNCYMETIYIFGDSFAAPNSYSYSWSNRLRWDYNIENFAHGGTGPDWSLKKFLKVAGTVRQNSYCIFMVSDIYRLSLKFMSPQDSHKIRFFLGGDQRTLPSAYEKHKKFIDNLFRFHLFYSTFTTTELIKIILFIKFNSDRFKKTLIFPCFDELKNIDLQKMNVDKNFYVHDNPLKMYAQVSQQTDNHEQNTRPNHMIESQHLEFYNLILKLLKLD